MTAWIFVCENGSAYRWETPLSPASVCDINGSPVRRAYLVPRSIHPWTRSQLSAWLTENSVDGIKSDMDAYLRAARRRLRASVAFKHSSATRP